MVFEGKSWEDLVELEEEHYNEWVENRYQEKLVSQTKHDLLGWYFTIEGHSLKDIVLNAIALSEKNIDLFMPAFTDMDIATKIIDARKRNIHIRVLVDNDRYQSISVMKKCIDYMKANQVEVNFLLCNNKKVRSNAEMVMNHQCLLVDGDLVLSGSYSYTWSASTINSEDLLVNLSTNSAQKWIEHFDSIWK